MTDTRITRILHLSDILHADPAHTRKMIETEHANATEQGYRLLLAIWNSNWRNTLHAETDPGGYGVEPWMMEPFDAVHIFLADGRIWVARDRDGPQGCYLPQRALFRHLTGQEALAPKTPMEKARIVDVALQVLMVAGTEMTHEEFEAVVRETLGRHGGEYGPLANTLRALGRIGEFASIKPEDTWPKKPGS